jgi:hypothetical protein
MAAKNCWLECQSGVHRYWLNTRTMRCFRATVIALKADVTSRGGMHDEHVKGGRSTLSSSCKCESIRKVDAIQGKLRGEWAVGSGVATGKSNRREDWELYGSGNASRIWLRTHARMCILRKPEGEAWLPRPLARLTCVCGEAPGPEITAGCPLFLTGRRLGLRDPPCVLRRR